jgi:glycine cleavage system H lipoate-binding protein
VREGLLYLPSHEWVKVEGDTATVGVSDTAQVRPHGRASSSWLGRTQQTWNRRSPAELAYLPFTQTICSAAHCPQELLGDVVYVELPAVGDELEQGKPFGVVESVKASKPYILLLSLGYQ